MQIEVKDPATGALLELKAKPEQFKGIHGFRIRHPNGSGFFVTGKSGAWRSGDDHHIDADFLVNIGLALEGRKLSEQIGSSHNKDRPDELDQEDKNEAGPYTDNQPNINSGIGEESTINPNES